MLSKSNWREVMGIVILCTGLVFGLTPFVSADDKPEPDCVLCGHITDSTTGEAVTDAIIRIDGRSTSQVKADTNGFYFFKKISEHGNYRIWIDTNEYVGIYNYDETPGVNLKEDNQVVKDFKLSRACMIKVQVVDEANQPVTDAEISVNYRDDERIRNIGSDMLRRKTDKEGFYLVGSIPPKTNCLITATHSIKTVTEDKNGIKHGQRQWDYAPGRLAATLNNTEVTESGKIVLQKGIDVNGIARYLDNVPASDLKIEAHPDWWGNDHSPEIYTIDANGHFTFRHITPGIYHIQVNIPTGENSFRIITVLQTTLPPSNNESLMVTIPQKSPEALASIRGKFTFAGDKVPNYIDIQADSPGSRYNSSTWNKYGRDVNDTNFVIDRLEPGKYKLTFSSQETEPKVIEDVNAPSEGLLVELLPRGKMFLKGTVLNSEDDLPIQNFKARARKTKILRGANYQQSDKWLEVSDANGEFNIETAGPGIYQVQIAADGFAWTWSQDVNTDSNNPVVIKLSAGGGIKGKVVTESGKPIKGAKVLPLSMAGVVWIIPGAVKDPFISEDGEVKTADDGIFKLKHLAPGKESIRVIHPDYAYSTVNDIEVKDGQTTEDVNVVMPAGGTAEGYVYDTQGQPQPNVTLYFQDIYNPSSNDKGGRFATVTTDANGYYRAAGLPEQLLTVKRRQEGSSSMGVVCRTLVPASGKVSHIDLGGRPIVSGRIIINGIPLANRMIVLSSSESPNSNAFRCYAMTGPDGKFTFGGVPSGKWKIYCEDTETQGDWIKTATPEVTGQDVDLGVVSVTLSTIRASVENEQGMPKWDIKHANLQEGDELWGMPAKKVILPTEENNPYIIKNIPAGKYRLSLMRQDYVAFRPPIEVNETDVNVTVPIPKSISGIHGHLTGKIPVGQTIWTGDKSIVGTMMPNADFNYKLDNLPAGHYYVGGNMLIDSAAILEFDLADGEQKVLDINVPDDPLKNKQTGVLLVMALDENGASLLGADVHLLGGESVIKPMIDSSQGIYFMAEQGAYTLQVDFHGYKTVTHQVSIERFDPKNRQVFRKPVLVRLERQ